MFPRILFIFFLILSPSLGSESEGPSETECRPYIEKALLREGAPQEPGQATDVGEPPSIDETLIGSKDVIASGEQTSGSTEDLEDSGGTFPEIEVASVQTNSESGDAVIQENVFDALSIESTAAASETSNEAVTEETTVESSLPILESTENKESEEGSQPEILLKEEHNVVEVQNTVEESSSEVSGENTVEVVSSADYELPIEIPVGNEHESMEQLDTLPETDLKSDDSNEIPSLESISQEIVSAEIGGGEVVSEETIGSNEESLPAETLSAGSDTPPNDEPVANEEVSKTDQPEHTVNDNPSNEDASIKITDDVESTESITVETELSSETVVNAAEDTTISGSISTVSTEEEPVEVKTTVTEDVPVSEETVTIELATTVDDTLSTETETLPAKEVSTERVEGEASIEEGSGAQEIQTAAPTEEVETSPSLPEEELIMPIEIPSNLRTRDHMSQILKLAPEADEKEKILGKTMDSTLRDLKKLYDVAIKPLEILYKYRDLSNRHFGDPEIFSKPLVLFMGPWSGGKSTIINYLLENEFKKTALRSGAEPSPAYFNIVMWGDKEEILDGTQLAADWTFSGLQKFGQGLLDRLRGLKLNHPLLQKVNIVEIPGILEIRKQVERLFPFNDACQWFIDRADIIFLVYDPSKLDVGPETEAILDQLKGREMQTRIILNKADQVKPEELMRVQGTLIWNISPLMSSTEPPVMYSTSLWSLPYEIGAPGRLLYAQECGFLKDLREAIDKRVENKIASARRFAVRVRNHAKMVDCYLTTYYNHKSFFGNKKKVSDDIIEHPQNYHIYEGLSTLTNISRYDLPDPDVYRDFFRLNPVYEFQQLSATCTYFRGCPINRLDVAIAYDLPELVGKYKKTVEEVLSSRK